jgi:hypothetical protein
MSVISPLPNNQSPYVLEKGNPSVSLYIWLQQVYSIVFSIQQSGTTSNRPTTGLWVGRQYFDTTLGYPVWVSSINSTTYVATWHNGAGSVV